MEINGKMERFGKLEYGKPFDDTDNTWNKTYNLTTLTNYDSTISVEHPRDNPNFKNTDYKLEITMDGVGKLKTPIMEHKITNIQWTK